MVMAQNHIILPGDVPQSMTRRSPSSVSVFLEGQSLKSIMNEVEARVLSDARPDTAPPQAAEALGIDQSNIVRKAKKLKLIYPK